MKLEIRNGVFETNSSSTHALAIGKGNIHNVPKTITFVPADYGWEFEDYSCGGGTGDTASYFYTALLCLFEGEKLVEQLKNVEAALKEFGVEEVHWKEPSKDRFGYNECGIDHSYELDEFVNMLLMDKDMLYSWLFDDNSGFITGNDNDDSCDYVNDWEEKMKNNPDIIKTYYKGN